MGLSLASKLALLPEAQRDDILKKYSHKHLLSLKRDWSFWGRPEQIEPEGDWSTWLALAGRGWGKTEAGAQWVKSRVENGARSIALIAETQRDLEDVMVKRLLSIYPDGHAPTVTLKPVRITWANGATATGYNGTEPDQLRGPEFDTAWCFIAGTMVDTESGPKPIETIRAGDRVWTRAGIKPVSATASRNADVGETSFSNGANLIGTADHPLQTPHGWTKMGHLQKGDAVCAINAASRFSPIGELYAVSVASTWRPMGEMSVYCLTVEDQPEYIANGILVHNCDEFAKYRKAEELWDMLQMTLRVGETPKTLITTTPRPIPILKKILAAESTVVSSGSTFDNAGNLSPKFLERIKADYEGTRLGRQELYAHILDDNPNALFHQRLIHEARVDGRSLPDFNMTVVGVDPPATGNPDSDECGIIVASRDQPNTNNAHFYVQDDQSIQGRSPEGWAAQAVSAYYKHSANAIVAEVNQGGDMVEAVIKGVDKDVKVIKVRATKGKWIRAEPVAGLYEQGRVHHVGSFATLEDQMCEFDPSGLADGKSPDRLDALVWAITELSNRKIGEPSVRSL